MLASAAFGLLAVFFYFFSTYFPMLYLFAMLFLFLKLASFEMSELREEKMSGSEKIEGRARQISFEITDILLWVTIILADTHYYVIGIFVLAVFSMIYFFSALELKSKKTFVWFGYFNSINRTMFLLPMSLLQLVAQRSCWRVDFFYLFFCLIALAGLASITIYVYPLFSREILHHKNE